MMDIIRNNFTMFITTLTLLTHVLFFVFLVLIVFEKKFRNWFYQFVNTHVLVLIFGASLVAMVSSLIYSNAIGFPPCEFCWIQRIFMYPQVVISFMAFFYKDKNIVKYLLALSVLGGLAALYHSFAQWGIGTSLLECMSMGGVCGKLYVYEYGYITIPLMSFTIFAYLILISVVYFKSLNDRG